MRPNLSHNIDNSIEELDLGLASNSVKSRDLESGTSDVFCNFVNSEMDDLLILENFNHMNDLQDEVSHNMHLTSDPPLSELSSVGTLQTSSLVHHFENDVTFLDVLEVDDNNPLETTSHLDTYGATESGPSKLIRTLSEELLPRGKNSLPILDLTPVILNDVTTPDITKSSISSEELTDETEKLSSESKFGHYGRSSKNESVPYFKMHCP